MMDFAGLPPEINSTLIYTGPGAAPMMAAAAGWSSLGAELYTTASTYQSVITALSSEAWLGPSSAAMAAAIAPHLTWMYATAAAAERAAGQAAASAAAYEQAFAMTVPPPVVLENRMQLAVLVATNILGQNTPAIAANEAHYAEMWAQDATAMYGYAAASSAAAVLPPLTPPTSPVNPAGLATSSALSAAQPGLAQLVANLPTAMQGLSQPLAGSAGSSGVGGLLSDIINSTGSSGLWNTLQGYTTAATNVGAWHLFAGIGSGIGLEKAGPGALESTVVPTTGAVLADSKTAAGRSGEPRPVAADLGEAYTVDGLSVPPSWAAAVPEDVDAVTLASAEVPNAAVHSVSEAVPVGNYGLAAAAMAPLAFRARSSAPAAPSKSLLGRSRARKRRSRIVRAQPKSS